MTAQKRAYGSDFPFRDLGQLPGVEPFGTANPSAVSGADGVFEHPGVRICPSPNERLTIGLRHVMGTLDETAVRGAHQYRPSKSHEVATARPRSPSLSGVAVPVGLASRDPVGYPAADELRLRYGKPPPSGAATVRPGRRRRRGSRSRRPVSEPDHLPLGCAPLR